MRRKSIRTISESTKVTLTISQLRRLVNESISESRREKSHSERLDDALDVMLSRQLEEYEERCDEENPKSDFDKLCIALDILTDEQIEELYD